MKKQKYLYEDLDTFSNYGGFNNIDLPNSLVENLNKKFIIRDYQTEAFKRFIYCFTNDYPNKKNPLHFLFNMATGSGKTLVMAGLILYLYEKGYRNFLFFVNSTNIIEKTKDNFLNSVCSKYLFHNKIVIHNKNISIHQVDNFEDYNPNGINICFTTIQKLHLDLTTEKENSLTYEDFKNKKIVLLADEAHHINTRTKSKVVKEIFNNWEDTVERIFKQNEDNLLLEFTATIDYSHLNIVEKYLNKVIYKYDLREFRNDKYSKEVSIIQSDFDDKFRIIQSLILSQYKQEVAAKYRINLKPVILFKAQRTIAQSQQNKENFETIIDELSADDIQTIKEKSNIFLLKRAFAFFNENKIKNEYLVKRLKNEFSKDRCISVNEEKEKELQQILLNTLEDKTNNIRAIFAVQKLNEGWDVLNLFDIVRCYEGRDSKAGKPGKTTISEAQLIGRGARYFPWTLDEFQNKFIRKFDDDLNNELRVLEELHYHSINDSSYISELRTALIQEGMLDEKVVEKELNLKPSFLKTKFYKNGLIYINEKIKNTCKDIYSLKDLGVSKKNFNYSIMSGHGTENILLKNGINKQDNSQKKFSKDIKLSEIPEHLIKNALAKNEFYYFDNLTRHFPNITSMNDFVKSPDYLGGLEISFEGTNNDLENISNKNIYYALIDLFDEIKKQIKSNTVEYKGTTNFKPHSIKKTLFDVLSEYNYT